MKNVVQVFVFVENLLRLAGVLKDRAGRVDGRLNRAVVELSSVREDRKMKPSVWLIGGLLALVAVSGARRPRTIPGVSKPPTPMPID